MNVMDKKSNIREFDRYLAPLDVWGLALGCMVGWGAFVMPGTTFMPVAGPAGTLVAMAVGFAVMLIIGCCLSFLMTRIPGTGGMYTYTKEVFGRDHAFLCSWFLCLSYLTVVFLNGTALFLVLRTLFGVAAHGGAYYTVAGHPIFFREVALSVGALAGVGLLSIVAKPILQRLNTALAMLLFLGALVVSFFCLPHALTSDILASGSLRGINLSFGVFSLVILAPWAFVGFEVASFDTAHFKFPVQKANWIIFIALLMAALVYAALALVSLAAIPEGYASWESYFADLPNLDGVLSVPVFYAARTVMGNKGLAVVGATALAAILTGIIGAYRATLRVLSTMAEDRILSEKFSKTSYSIMFIMILSILISLLGRNTLIWFVDLTSFGAIVAYGYTAAAAFRIAKADGNRLIMTAGFTGTVIAVIFAIVQLVPHLAAVDAMGSEAFLLLSMWCLLGFGFYWKTVKRSSLTEYSGMSTSGTALFALLVYAALMWLGMLLEKQKNVSDLHYALYNGGAVMILIIFVGLTIMLYIQNLVRVKHEAAEREKIRAVEGSLAKSQFLFNMSHDIRTPMNAIIGYTNLALQESSLDNLRGYLGKIQISSRHLLALINDILEMSRIENGKAVLENSPADICALFGEMRDLFSAQMRQKNIDFSVSTDEVKNRCVWCDKNNLNRVLLNILSNAFKFTPAGGKITASLVETSCEEAGFSAYIISVCDTGIGMSAEFAEKMFNAFERERTSTDSGVEGTGLGLAITKNLLDMMGGTIEVKTSAGVGTEIVINIRFRTAAEADLPKEESSGDEAAQAASEESGVEDTVDFAGKRLLLVEDNAINMEIAKMILEQMGFEIETAENGKIAVEMIAGAAPGYYDAVLMDIQMPIMDGYAATKAVRALADSELSAVPILAMTANTFKEDVEAARAAGMQAHIAKPIDVAVLTKELKAVLK